MVGSKLAKQAVEPMGLIPSRRMRTRFVRELEQARIGVSRRPAPLVTPDEVATLPGAARRCLAFAGAIGSPRVWSVRAHAMGTLRLASSTPWMNCEAWQYAERDPVARGMQQRLRYGQVVPVLFRDIYSEGHGRVLGRVADSLSVVDASQDEVTLGELAAFTGDALLLAPSMLLGPATRWSDVDGSTFDVELHDQGWVHRARVSVDDRGAVTEVSTLDRAFPTKPESSLGVQPIGRPRPVPTVWTRARWCLRVKGWGSAEGRRFAHRTEAVWDFTASSGSRPAGGPALAGEFRYAELQYDEVDFNVLVRDEVQSTELGVRSTR